MTLKTLYEKRGRRYYPVAEERVFDGVSEGDWLVTVKPGLRVLRRLVTPAIPEVEAAMTVLKDEMTDAMMERSKPHFDVKRSISASGKTMTAAETERYQRAYKAWVDIVGEQPLYFQGVSVHDVLDAGLNVLRRHMMEQGAAHGAQEES